MAKIKVSVLSDWDGVGMTAGQDSGFCWLREEEIEADNVENLIKKASEKVFGGIYNKVTSCLNSEDDGEDEYIVGWWFIYEDEPWKNWVYEDIAHIGWIKELKNFELKDGKKLVIVPEIEDFGRSRSNVS